MQYDAVIFDLFGTLIDYLPEEDYVRMNQQITSILAVPPDIYRQRWNETRDARDIGRYGSIEKDIEYVSHAVGGNPTTAQIAAATEVRLSVVRKNLQPREGAISTLTKLKEAGYRVGLVSDCASEVPRLWGETAFAPLLEATVFSVETGVTKPHPLNYRLVCEQLGVLPSRCLYIGDGSSTELTGATQFGMDAILICVPHERRMVMEREDPQRWQGPVIESLEEVFGYLGMANRV